MEITAILQHLYLIRCNSCTCPLQQTLAHRHQSFRRTDLRQSWSPHHQDLRVPPQCILVQSHPHYCVCVCVWIDNKVIYGVCLVSFPDPFRKNREGVWQHVLHRRVRTHCTVRANQVAEFSYVMFIKNVRLWRLLTVLVLLILTRLLMLPVGE